MPVSHTCSHYFGRGKENTRFDLENVDSFCNNCHNYMEDRKRTDYKDFKIKQLGLERFNKLRIKSEKYCKKNRELELIKIKKLYGV